MTEKPDLTALPYAKLVEQALTPGDLLYRALDELARRVREVPSDWKINDWDPLSRPPTPDAIELAFLELSQRENETDGEFSCSQDPRIRELEARPDVEHGMVTEFMNRVVDEQRKV